MMNLGIRFEKLTIVHIMTRFLSSVGVSFSSVCLIFLYNYFFIALSFVTDGFIGRPDGSKFPSKRRCVAETPVSDDGTVNQLWDVTSDVCVFLQLLL